MEVRRVFAAETGRDVLHKLISKLARRGEGKDFCVIVKYRGYPMGAIIKKVGENVTIVVRVWSSAPLLPFVSCTTNISALLADLAQPSPRIRNGIRRLEAFVRSTEGFKTHANWSRALEDTGVAGGIEGEFPPSRMSNGVPGRPRKYDPRLDPHQLPLSMDFLGQKRDRGGRGS